MIEADEVAATLRPMFVAVVNPKNRSMDMARRFVREWLTPAQSSQCRESPQMVDNIAWALTAEDRKAEQIRKEKHDHEAT